MSLTLRRFSLATLVAATVALLSAWLTLTLTQFEDGFGFTEAIMVAMFAIKTIWVAINFWNAVIGFVVLRQSARMLMGITAVADSAAIEGRIAIVMTVCDEEVPPVVARLQSMKASLDASERETHFDYYLLSDTRRHNLAVEEEHAIEAWRARTPNPERIVYRRRAHNLGAQHGNLFDFCTRFGDVHDVMIVLDADSLMTTEAIVSLVRGMQGNPRIGMLQSLNEGILPSSLFARVFEFGHRHFMRCWIAGAAWWQDERGQYRGHNAAIRVRAYRKNCSLASLPGNEPFGGVMFCHDQIESALMHRAGYEIRELYREGGSYEGVPPTLTDFLTRYCRWFQGNLTNLRLLRLSGLTAMDRYHLIGVAHRFLTWPAVVVFVALALIQTLSARSSGRFPAHSAAWLGASYAAIYFAPKILGLIDYALRAPGPRGGLVRLVVGAALDFVLTILLLPIAMLSATFFAVKWLAGSSLSWDTQRRAGYRLSWSAAVRVLWPQTVVGAGTLAALAYAAPSAILWFAPFLTGLILSIPLAVITTLPGLNRFATRFQICALPEEIAVPREVATLLQSEAVNPKADAII